MMDMRPLVLDDNNVVLGGNMRLKACTDLKWKEVPYIRFTEKDWEENEKNLPEDERKSYEDRCNEFVIKDNAGFGEWDWDILANAWNTEELTDWGLDLWKQEDIDYEPMLEPSTDYSDVTDAQINAKAEELAKQMMKEIKHQEVICPNCEHEFEVQL